MEYRGYSFERMNRTRQFYKFGVIGLAAAGILVAGCNRGGVSDNTIVTVNGTPINSSDFFEYLQRKSNMIVMSNSGPVNAQVEFSPGYQAMQDMIVDQIVIQLAKEQNVFPNDQQVNAELDFQKQQNPNFVQQAIANGYTLESLKHELMMQVSRFNLITKGITVTPQQVNDFITQHPDQFENPPKATLQMIVVKSDQKKAAVDKDLGSGKAFQVVAQTYSEQQNGRNSNYTFPIDNIPQMPKPIQDLVTKTGVNQTTDWLRASDGWVKFYVVSKTASTKQPITDVTKEKVRRFLMQQQGSQAHDLQKDIAKKLQSEADQIKIQKPQYQQAWNNFIQNMNTALQQSTASGSGGAPAASTAPAGGAAPAAGN